MQMSEEEQAHIKVEGVALAPDNGRK